MRKLLLLTARDIHGENGEWRLIANRAELLARVCGIETEARAAVREEKMLSDRRAAETFGLRRSFYPANSSWGFVATIARMGRDLLAEHHDFENEVVILSGAPAYVLSALMPGSRVLIDLHGALEELLEYPSKRFGPRPVSAGIAKAMLLLERWAVRRSAGVIAVTEELGEYARERDGARRVFVVPCGGEHLGIAGAAEKRREWRRSFGLEDEIAFVYSGGRSAWQRLDETIRCYLAWRREMPRRTKLLLFSGEYEWLRKRAEEIGVEGSEIVALALPASKVVEALLAADVGFVIRDETVTNRVAFPNKFAEYCAAGLIVVTSKGLKEPARLVRERGNGVLVEPANIERDAGRTAGQLKELVGRREKDWAGFQASSLAFVQERMSMEAGVRSLGAFLNELLEAPAVGSRVDESA